MVNLIYLRRIEEWKCTSHDKIDIFMTSREFVFKLAVDHDCCLSESSYRGEWSEPHLTWHGV